MMLEHSARVPVSREFRERVLDEYPQAFVQERFGRLLQELLFPRWRDDIIGDPVMSRAMLAVLEGREADLANNRYVGLPFLRAFEAQLGVTLRLEEAAWLQGRARTARLCLPTALEHVLAFELTLPPAEKMVDFVSGRPVSLRDGEQARARRRAARRAHEPRQGPGAKWVRFLNATLPHIFRRFEQNFDPAVAVADSFGCPCRRHANLCALHMLRRVGLDSSYQQVERTPRIYTSGWSMAQLSSNVRAVLLSGALHFDLAAAQLAIIVALWKLPIIAAVLKDFTLRGRPCWPWPGCFQNTRTTSRSWCTRRRMGWESTA